jgi:hypothetical protein
MRNVSPGIGRASNRMRLPGTSVPTRRTRAVAGSASVAAPRSVRNDSDPTCNWTVVVPAVGLATSSS